MQDLKVNVKVEWRKWWQAQVVSWVIFVTKFGGCECLVVQSSINDHLCCWECENTHIIGSFRVGIVLRFCIRKVFRNSIYYFILVALFSKVVRRSSIWGCGITIYKHVKERSQKVTFCIVLCGFALCDGC